MKYKISGQLHKKLVEMEKKAMKHHKKATHEEYFTKIPEIVDKSKYFDCAANCVELKQTENLGRHLVATKNIEPGDVIAVEKPYTSILLTEFFNTHCFNCFKISYNLIPCLNCTVVMFCSTECRESSMSLHKYECPFLLTLVKLGVSKLQFLALRVVISARNYFDKDLTLPNDKYESGRYLEIHHLISNQDKRTPSDLFKRAINAAVFYHILLSSHFFDQFSDDKQDEVRRFVAANLLHHLQTAPSNMHEIGELNGINNSEEGKT